MVLGLVDGAEVLAAFTVTGADWFRIQGLTVATIDTRKDGASSWFGLSGRGQALMLRTLRLHGEVLYEVRGEPDSGIHLLAAGGNQLWELRAAPTAALAEDVEALVADTVSLDAAGRIVVSGDRPRRTRPLRPDRAASLGASLGLLLDDDPLCGAAGPVGNFDVLEAWPKPDGMFAVRVTLGGQRFEVAETRTAIAALSEALRVRASGG